MIPRNLRTALIGAATALALLLPQSMAMAAPAPDNIDKAVLADLAADDKATFWVHLKGSADLSSAAQVKTKAGKAEAVYRAKTAFADSSQAELIKLLKAAGADYTPFWIANAVRVNGNAELAARVVRTPQVTRIAPVRTIDPPKPIPGQAQATMNAVEWNIDRVNAPRVWNELGTRGEGVVVANIDSGVQFDHPALAAQYRGKKADGTVDHNYNWFDPAGMCSTAAPCDNNNHGTHTMGTMVGDDGGTNQIGVAPGAKWIAAKGCEASGCSDASLLAAGQWMLAPTDLDGANPRPDLAPDIVNNSWGGPGFDPWYKQVVDAWVAAGIFPVFSNGNSTNAGCNSSGSPGQYVASYSAGAFDANNAIAGFSTRGSGENGEIKPNIAAPGVSVRSSVNGGGYRPMSGTSMAAPHVAGAAALLWSASPALDNDIAATRELLDRTAVDMNDTSCGGTAADNNVWGEGRLDAFAAVQAAPVSAFGALNGTVTSGGTAVAGATATVTGPQSRTAATGQDGTYSLPRLLPGDYRITVTKFGYGDATATATVTAGQTATANVTLTESPPGSVSGTVIHAGVPAAGAEVAATGTPAKTVTDAAGRYRLELPKGTYNLRVTPVSRCASSRSAPITISGDLTKDFDLLHRSDAFGHVCASGAEPYIAGTDKLGFGGDIAVKQVYLPFTFPMYGEHFTSIFVHIDGTITPLGSSPWVEIYPYLDDLVLDDIYTATLGTAPQRTFIVEWRNATLYHDNTARFSVSAALGEDGSIRFFYKDLDTLREFGKTASIGIQNFTDGTHLWYSRYLPALSNGQSLTFTASRHGLVSGLVTNANDGDPLPGATVKIDTMSLTTGADGRFYGQAPVGDHKAEVSKEHYGTFVQDVSITAGALTGFDTALATGRITVRSDEVLLVMPPDAQRSGSIELRNLGGATAYTVVNDPAQTWLTATPENGDLAAGASATVKATASSAGMRPGDVRIGRLLIRSASARRPEIEITVRAIVPKHQVALDVGGGKDVVDTVGDRWSKDGKYTAGGHGYIGGSRVRTTTRAIKGTSEQELFKSARESMLEYRFDNVPNGTYTVELAFADLRSSRPGQRVFDVTVEGQLAVPALDLALQTGTYTALTRQYTVKVADGQLNVHLVKRSGKTVVNAIRIFDRPDKAVP
ncbi:Serine protease, subtilisin family [Sinosporangium album]|uniref:Serine protease, subtilisin family n=1 Tax=Sinosporangium album TaxID=504805 RepID=A0A1G7TJY8_9ACTN|nr:S8 family serine peptidase [Sinosporangium album]SDG35646.1 Serine protease, subtilisin family [Sinosporangium album]